MEGSWKDESGYHLPHHPKSYAAMEGKRLPFTIWDECMEGWTKGGRDLTSNVLDP
jgi:hypothetical protein